MAAGQRVGGAPGGLTAANLPEVVRQLQEAIFRLEGRKGEIPLQDALAVVSTGKVLSGSKAPRGEFSICLGGTENSSVYLSKGACLQGLSWIAHDSSAMIVELSRDESGPKLYYDTNLSVGGIFTPTLYGWPFPLGGTARQVLISSATSPTGVEWITPPYCSLVTDSSQTLTTGVITPVAFAAEVLDDSGMHDNVTNNTRVTIAVPGKYSIHGSALFINNATGVRFVGLHKGGAEIQRGTQVSTANGSETGCNVSAIVNLAASEYLELVAYQTSGGNLGLYSGYSRLQVMWMGA